MTAALSLSRVSYAYPGGREALRDVTIEAAEGEALAVIGPTGAGKTTLLLHMNGLLRGSGEVRVEGELIGRHNLPLIRSRVGTVFQDPNDQLFMPTVLEDVLFGPLSLGRDRAAAEAEAERLLAGFGLSGELDTPPDRLSLGQKKKVALAGVLVMEPSVLLLDEPTANLDPGTRRRLIEDLKRLGGTRIVSSHDLDFVWEICDRVVLMDSGSIVARGPCRKLLADENLLESHGLEVPLSARLASS